MAQTYGERGHEAWTLRLLGDIHASHDSSRREAEECYRQSMLIAQERGMRPLVAHCHVGLGKLYRNRGNREQAREFLGNATAMYREMDMPLWLEKAESALESV
jgi:sugar phosphate isomerase/epimerase